MKNKLMVWVVEQREENYHPWEVMWVETTRKLAYMDRQRLSYSWPDNRFRVKKYVPEVSK